MQYTTTYQSPMGALTLAADDKGLTGLWIEGQKYYARKLAKEHEERETSAHKDARRWLDVYFSGREPSCDVPLHLVGTDFQNEVWQLLREIPYGQTTTYGELARQVAERRGLERMSSQAVGDAVGHNSISIIVPCHRVVGANGSLTGYAGGIARKIELLKLEGAWQDRFFVPKRSTAP